VIIDLLAAGTTFGETRVFLEKPHLHLGCAALDDTGLRALARVSAPRVAGDPTPDHGGRDAARAAGYHSAVVAGARRPDICG
jgi:hypothetical protein